MMGLKVINTALLIGVDNVSPLKNANILMDIPNAAASNIFGQSERSIFCFGAIIDTSQNNSAPLQFLGK